MKWIRRILRLTFTATFLFLLWKSGVASVFVGPVDLNLKPTTGSTIVKDASGNTAFQVNSSGKDEIPLSQIPLIVQNAFVSAEDARFYENPLGIDFRGIARALIVDIKDGGATQGASTIPEQLGKIAYLGDQKTLLRKIRQIILGTKISLKYTKPQILDMYLNRVYLGDGATGVAEAAATYFNKRVDQLTLPEAALIAGLPQAPSYYNPWVNPATAKERRNTVLQLMRKYGYITQDQLDTALSAPVTLDRGYWDGLPPADEAYQQYVFEEADRIGFGADALKHGGLTVYTDLNPKLQESLYMSFTQDGNFPQDMNGEKAQAGAVFLDSHTGGVAALMNGRGGSQYHGFDHATMTRRSPGSSIKPVVVYAPAVDSGKYSPDSPLYSGPLDIAGYSPKDWKDHNTTNGTVTLKEALDMSWNIPAVWLLHEIGIDTGISFGTLDGLHFTPADAQHLGVALGDISAGVSPMDMAEAYQAFDNGGIRIQAHAIEKIVNSQGATIYEAEPGSVRVMKPSTAKVMTDLLRDVVVHGIGHDAGVNEVFVAGKTGSTAFAGTDGDSDIWFCGYTPSFVGSIWMGFDQTDANHYISASSGGSVMPARLFSSVIQSYVNATSTAGR